MIKRDERAGDAARRAAPATGSSRLEGGHEADERPGQHHALEPDVEDARLLGHDLAQARVEQRHAGHDAAER